MAPLSLSLEIHYPTALTHLLLASQMTKCLCDNWQRGDEAL